MAAGGGRSMLGSMLLFTVVLSLQEVYRGKLASSELFTILGGFTSSLLFLFSLTFIGNLQESSGTKSSWGAVYARISVKKLWRKVCLRMKSSFIFLEVVIAVIIALVAASTVHRVCITTCFLFSAGLLYEMNKISGYMLSESKSKRH